MAPREGTERRPPSVLPPPVAPRSVRKILVGVGRANRGADDDCGGLTQAPRQGRKEGEGHPRPFAFHSREFSVRRVGYKGAGRCLLPCLGACVKPRQPPRTRTAATAGGAFGKPRIFAFILSTRFGLLAMRDGLSDRRNLDRLRGPALEYGFRVVVPLFGPRANLHGPRNRANTGGCAVLGS